MKVQFFKDGRKTNTIKTKDTDGTEISTQQELKTFAFECPLSECNINMDAYSRGTEWEIYPKGMSDETINKDETWKQILDVLHRTMVMVEEKIMSEEVKP